MKYAKKMTETSATDEARMKYINYLMDELYESLPPVYEALVEQDKKEIKDSVGEISKILKRIVDSIEDEI